jgi:mono/diheme cytochrome c family protein
MRSLVVALLACAALAGCERQMHNMYAQPRYDPGAGSPLWRNGRAGRPPVDGTVAATPPAQATASLARGQERYSIYCLPCHSARGDGNGPVALHGFPHPPNYREQRLREASDSYLYDVITQGHGIMYSYADRLTPEDRRAVVAYIRALQKEPQ